MKYHLHPLNDHAIIIDFGEDINESILHKIQTITAFLDEQPFEWMVEYVPAFTTVTIFYDPLKVLAKQPQVYLPYDYVFDQIHKLIGDLKTGEVLPPRIVTIPVCYGGDLGPDLEYVANYNNITTKEVIEIHSAGEYIVYMIGFAPGFPYIGGMSEEIFAPRRSSPRLKIPKGSVGIAGKQTGVYPIETPGGWQLIGQTPLHLFRPTEENPSLLQAGDRIKFSPITYKEFTEWEGQKL